jgi:hypothetical protein
MEIMNMVTVNGKKVFFGDYAWRLAQALGWWFSGIGIRPVV